MARPVAKDYDQKRRLILDRAAQLFADQGFDRTSVSSVAQACNISKANIFHYYPKKDDILFDILDTYLSTLRDRICQMDLSGLSATERFRVSVLEVLLSYQGADDEHRLQANGLGHLPTERQAVLIDYQRDLVAHFDGLIAALEPEVFKGQGAKLRAATMSVFGMLNWFYMWNGAADRKAREEYAETICAISLKGIPGL